jgi:hypothetical protein
MSRTTLAGLASRCPRGIVGMVAMILFVEGTIEVRSLTRPFCDPVFIISFEGI